MEAKTLMGTWKQWSGVFVDLEGALGGLGILWNANIQKVEEVMVSNMWQVCKFHSYPLNVDFTIINVYGPSKSTLQKKIWRTLSSLIGDLEGDLLIIEGNFNAILELSDKLGGNGEIPANLAHFQKFVTENGLMEIKSKEDQYTWSNRRISGQHVAEKLDHFFLGGPWVETNLLFASNVHPMTIYDHLPVELSITVDGPPIRCPFKFEKLWLRDQSQRELINGWWSGAPKVCGSKAFIFVKKLQFIKSKIKEWNLVKFGNILANKRDLEDRLASLQEDIIQKGMTSKKF
ncbi:uncharacterized protein LOC131857407 [Cryptomeria japonica]|uniref:uncharacterized protein LOC131857407 n=1 Tax=Cryptomeria japonica TaxID=3369 RepID=UPI0027DA0C8A|nr:uncharacterized protein LOC131857407 [Cryptomeria japonica]